MFVVGKLNSKLLRSSRIAKRITSIFPRRRLQMANKTYLRIGASEKLTSVAGDTGIVVGVVGDIGIISNLPPVFSWTLMTGDARSAVLVGRMGKSGVIDPTRWRDWPAPRACLRRGGEIANDDCYQEAD